MIFLLKNILQHFHSHKNFTESSCPLDDVKFTRFPLQIVSFWTIIFVVLPKGIRLNLIATLTNVLSHCIHHFFLEVGEDIDDMEILNLSHNYLGSPCSFEMPKFFGLATFSQFLWWRLKERELEASSWYVFQMSEPPKIYLP